MVKFSKKYEKVWYAYLSDLSDLQFELLDSIKERASKLRQLFYKKNGNNKEIESISKDIMSLKEKLKTVQNKINSMTM